MKTILKPLAIALLLLIAALSLNALVGALLAYLLGIPAWMGAVTLTLIALVIYPFLPSGSARAGVMQEVWTGVMIKALVSRYYLVRRICRQRYNSLCRAGWRPEGAGQ